MTPASVLTRALFIGDADKVSQILSQNPDLAASHPWQQLFFESIRFERKLNVARLALDNGADINAFDSSGNTALMTAVRHAPKAIWLFLLNNGANVYKGNASFNPIQQAILTQNADFLRAATESDACDLSEVDTSHGYGTPLQFALHMKQKQMALTLLSLSADPNPLPIEHGWSLLHKLTTLAPSEHDTKLTSMLVESGASCDARDKHGLTPLLFATQRGRTHIVKTLHTCGADIHAVDNKGQNALLLAVVSPLANGFPLLTQYLLAEGVDKMEKSHAGLCAAEWIRCMVRDMKQDDRWKKLEKILNSSIGRNSLRNKQKKNSTSAASGSSSKTERKYDTAAQHTTKDRKDKEVKESEFTE